MKTEKLNSLYDKLRAAEQMQENWEKYRESIGSLQVPELPEVDVAHVQRDIFIQYEGNPILQAAINGEKSVEQTLQEVAKYNRNLRRFLPRGHDREHNKKIDHLEKLVGSYLGKLKSMSVFYPDNFFTISAYVGIMGCALQKWFGSATQNPELMKTTVTLLWAFTAATYGLIFNMFQREPVSKKTFEQARYIDQKIKELFKSE